MSVKDCDDISNDLLMGVISMSLGGVRSRLHQQGQGYQVDSWGQGDSDIVKVTDVRPK